MTTPAESSSPVKGAYVHSHQRLFAKGASLGLPLDRRDHVRNEPGLEDDGHAMVAERMFAQIEQRLGGEAQSVVVVALMLSTIAAMRDRRLAHHLKDISQLGLLSSGADGSRSQQTSIDEFFADARARGRDGVVDLLRLLHQQTRVVTATADQGAVFATAEIGAKEASHQGDGSASYFSLELGHVEQNADWNGAESIDSVFRALITASTLGEYGYSLQNIYHRDDAPISYRVRAAQQGAVYGSECFVVVRKRPVADIYHADGTRIELVRRSGFLVVPALFAGSGARHAVRSWYHPPEATARVLAGLTLRPDSSLADHLAAAKERHQARSLADIAADERLREAQNAAARLATTAALRRDDQTFRPGYFPIDTLYYARVPREQ